MLGKIENEFVDVARPLPALLDLLISTSSVFHGSRLQSLRIFHIDRLHITVQFLLGILLVIALA